MKKRYKTICVPMTPEEEAEADRQDAERRYAQGAVRPGETCEQANMRMGWGCKCHGETFCPDLVCIGYEEDVPIFKKRA